MADEEQSELVEQQASQPESLYSMLEPKQVGFVAQPSNVTYGGADDSVFMANLRDSTTYGSFLASRSAHVLDKEQRKNFDPIDHIPDNYLDYASRFLQDNNMDDINETTQAIDKEFNDKSLIAAHPWKSFAYGVPQQLFDPVNWFTAGTIFKSLKAGSAVIRGMAVAGTSAVASATIQESIIQRNQLTRETQESVYNVMAAGVIGSVLGGIGGAIGSKAVKNATIKERAQKEILNTVTDKDKDLTSDGLLKENDLVNMPETTRKMMNITPMNQLLNSPFGISRYFSASMYDNNYTFNKHLDLNTQGSSIERLIKADKQRYSSILIDYQDIFYKANGVEGGVFKGTRAKLEGSMPWQQFDEAVSHVLTTDIQSTNGHVNQAANHLRTKLFEPIKKQLIEAGELPADVSVENAANYFMIAFNKTKIVEQGGRSARGPGTFPQALHDGFKATQEKIKIFKESPQYKSISKSLSDAKESLEQLKAKKKLIPKDQKEKIKKINSLVKDVKEQIKNHNLLFKKAAPSEGLNSKGELFSIHDDATLWAHVEQTVDNILGQQDGQLLNPILDKLSSFSTKVTKERKIKLSQESLRDWHVTSASRIADMYVRATVPVIHLNDAAKRFGAKDLTELRVKISEQLAAEYKDKAQGVTGKAATKLLDQLKKDTQNMKDTFDLLLGVYGSGTNTLDGKSQQFYNNFLKWNAIRLLGNMTLSSLPDVGMQVLNGSYKHVHHGVVGSLKGMRNVAKQDLRAIGYGMEGELGSRFKAFSEHEGLSTEQGPFSKGFDALVQGFGNATLMNQWNSLQQNIAGTVSIHRTLETIHSLAEGKKVPKKDLVRMAKIGISQEHFKTIEKFTVDKVDGKWNTRFADWGNWDIKNASEAEALKQFQASVSHEIEQIVIVPGLGDKIKIGKLDANTTLGKFLFQFKSFLMASTNKVLYSGIQNRHDINTWLGVTSMLGMGAVSYTATSLVRGKEPDYSFDNLAQESIDRSGLLGVWMEVYNIGSKGLGFGGVSRYKSRDLAGALIGPTGGAINEVWNILRKSTDTLRDNDEFTTKDAAKLMRLIPYQNLFYLLQLNKAMTTQAAISLGATDTQ